MAKRTQPTDVFDMLKKLDDSGEVAEADPERDPDCDATQNDDAAMESSTDGDDTSDDDRRRQLRRRLVSGVVGVVVVAVLGASASAGWRLYQSEATAAASRAALDAARNYAVVLTTLDTKNIDENYKQALDGATGEFKDEYSQGSTQLRQILIDNKASATGMVVDSAVKSATRTKVEVLLFVDQSVTNALNPSPRIDRNRVDMTMELVDNRWLASKVEII